MLKAILLTFGTALLPVLEIRGAIPVGIAHELDPWLTYIVGVIGNMLPIPFLILLTRRIIAWLEKHNILVRFTNWLRRKGKEKSEVIEKSSFWGLMILVAIPLPGTGAWTGALVASFLDMSLRRSLPAITLGVLIAGGIVMAVTFGVISVGAMV